MPIVRSRRVELFWRIHKRLCRWSNGRIGAWMANLPVLLLETVGRRTAAARTNALIFPPGHDAFVVVVSLPLLPLAPDRHRAARRRPGSGIWCAHTD